jgi:hypothetical protein
MALDKAFENTYHVGEDGKRVFHTRIPGKITPHVTSYPIEGVNYRGLLMSPYTGTGKKQDPTIPPEKRKEEIKRSLGTEANRHLSYEDQENIVHAAHESGIPTHVFQKLNVSTTARDYFPNDPGDKIAGTYMAGKINLRKNLPNMGETLTHEVGHALDRRTTARDRARAEDLAHSETLYQKNKWGEKFTPSGYHQGGFHDTSDPIAEGTADGFQDRYAEPDRLASSLRAKSSLQIPTKLRQRFGDEPSSAGSRGEELTDTGYGTRTWNHPLDQSLYVAARAHSGVSKDPHNNLPALHELVPPRGAVAVPTHRSRDGGVSLSASNDPADNAAYQQSNSEAKTHFLGYMFHNHPHVRAALKQADKTSHPDAPSLYLTGQAASEKYRASQTSAAHTQPELGKMPWGWY